MIAPSQGVPRPLGKDSNNSKITEDEKKKADEFKLKADLEKRRKEETKRKIELQRHDLQIKELELQAWEAKHNSLVRELSALKNHTVVKMNFNFGSVVANPGSTLNLKVLERQKEVKVAEIEKEIAVIEREDTELERDTEKKKNLLIEKDKQAKTHGTQAESAVTMREKDGKELLRQISELRKELQEKSEELKSAENEDVAMKQEIETLKGGAMEDLRQDAANKQKESQISEKEGLLEKTIDELAKLEREFETKKQDLEARIKAFEKEISEGRSSQTKKADNKSGERSPIVEKEQQERNLLKQISVLKEEVKRKSLELEALETKEKDIQKDIVSLKDQTKELDSSKTQFQSEMERIEKEVGEKIAKNKEAIAKLKASIEALNRSFEIQRQDAEKAGIEMQEKKKQSENQTELIEKKAEEDKALTNRIAERYKEIATIKKTVQELQSVKF